MIHVFLASALFGGEWSTSRPGHFTPGEITPPPRYPLDRRLGGSQPGLDDVEKRKFLTLPRFELQALGRPARSQSLYRMRRSGSLRNKLYSWITLWENFFLNHPVQFLNHLPLNFPDFSSYTIAWTVNKSLNWTASSTRNEVFLSLTPARESLTSGAAGRCV
jgi:hypothetical protein